MARTTYILLALLGLLAAAAQAQVTPLSPGPRWRGTYAGSCNFPAAMQVVPSGAETLVAICLKDRLITVPTITSWDVDQQGNLTYAYLQDDVWTAPGTVPVMTAKPDIWVVGGPSKSTSVRARRAPNSHGLRSQCIDIAFADGSHGTIRASMYKMGAATVYQEEGFVNLYPFGLAPRCPEVDLAPLVCNSTSIISYKCVLHKISDNSTGVQQRLGTHRRLKRVA